MAPRRRPRADAFRPVYPIYDDLAAWSVHFINDLHATPTGLLELLAMRLDSALRSVRAELQRRQDPAEDDTHATL